MIALVQLGFALFILRGQSDFLARWIAWSACLTLGFLWGVHTVILEANRNTPPKLPREFYLLLAALGFGMTLWVLAPATHDRWGWPR